VDGSAATPDETFILNRAVASLNSTNLLTIMGTYTSIALGGSEARAACVLSNDTTWIAVDKGGLYQGESSPNVDNPNLNNFNNVVVKTFGGNPWVETQKAVAGRSIPVVYELGFDPGTGLWDVTFANNLGTDQYANDFYMISTNGGTSYDVLYIADQISGSQGAITKYSLVSGNWIASGTFTNNTSIDGLFAVTNANGGVNLFYTTGGGQNNSIVRVTDSAGWNRNITIIASNVLYTATGLTSLKGLTFAPQGTPNAVQPFPPPVLIPQTFAATNAPFSITNSPEDPLWRSSITLITVNGTPLSTAAYNTNIVGRIQFDPSQDASLQTPGAKTFVFSATGFSTNSVVQIIAGVPAKLAMITQPKAPVGNGGPLATQPVVGVQDQFGNAVASTATITAAPLQATWTLGGSTSKAAVSGKATFSGLTAFSTNSVTGAKISFTASGLTGVTSSAFNIPAPIQSRLVGSMLSNGKFVFGFTNVTGLSYKVLGTNNLSAPIATWPVIGSPVESPAGSGTYLFTNSPATNSAQFYILRQP
jgi:hypothetical protein